MKTSTTTGTDHLRGYRREMLMALAMVCVLAFATFALAAGIRNINVSATILTKNICKFDTGSAALPFGILDPANPVPVLASTSIDFRCVGSAGIAVFLITQDGGLNPLGPRNQMEHTAIPGQFLPYDLSLVHVVPPIPKNTWFTLTINGTMAGADYQVQPGDYEDTVVISIAP